MKKIYPNIDFKINVDEPVLININYDTFFYNREKYQIKVENIKPKKHKIKHKPLI